MQFCSSLKLQTKLDSTQSHYPCIFVNMHAPDVHRYGCAFVYKLTIFFWANNISMCYYIADSACRQYEAHPVF